MASSSSRPTLQPLSRRSGSGGSANQSYYQLQQHHHHQQQQYQYGNSGSNRTPSNSYSRFSPRRQRAQPQPYASLSLEDQHRINRAHAMREENELLIWSSLERNESIPQTRLHYSRVMLGIPTQDGDDKQGNDDDQDDEKQSNGSGSIEWEDDHTWDAEDHARMRPGIRYGPDGWWDPLHHKSAEERIRAEEEARKAEAAEQMLALSAAAGGGDIRMEDGRAGVSPRADRRRRDGKGTPGKRKSAGKKAYLGVEP